MTQQNRRWAHYLALLLAFVLVLAACGGDDDDTGDTTATTAAPAETTAAPAETTAAPAETTAAPAETTAAPSGEAYENPDEGVYADRIDYGLIYDQTGPTASTQTVFNHGILTVFEKTNAAGGINGRMINTIEEDEKYDAAVGVAAYNKLVSETPVVGITGANNSSLQAAIIEDVDQNGVPIIGAESTIGTALNPFRDYFFAMECTYADQADVAVPYAFQVAGSDTPTVATFVLNVASGLEYAELVQERVEKAGGSVVGALVIEPGAQEADAQTQELVGLDPDVIIIHGGTSSAVPTFNSFAKFGLTDTPVIGIFAQKVPAVAAAQPDVTANFAAVHCYSAANEAGVTIGDQVIADAEAAGYGPDEYLSTDFTNGYVVGMVIVEALTQAGNELNRQSLHDAVQGIQNFDTGGLSPAVTFGPDDRIGVEGVVPFTWDADAEAYSPVGTYEQWADCITNQYLTGNIDNFDVACGDS